MYRLNSIIHSHITDEVLNEIIQIKSVAWQYSYECQRQWIETNISTSDIHLILNDGNKNVAYLNLIEIEFDINNTFHHGYGIGNVCASEKGMGHGKELMKQTNDYLKSRGKIGVLFCHAQLVFFYEKMSWKLLDRAKVNLDFDNSHIETMVFNTKNGINNFTYLGRAF